MPLLMLVVLGTAYAMWSFELVGLDHVGVLAVLIFTFFFVTVSARLVGLVGSSSNPVSGMTIATLLATALVYKYFVMGDSVLAPDDLSNLRAKCLFVGAIACIGITIGGDTAQDLKTGYLVGATPYKQQIGELIGVLTSVLVIAGLLILLNKTYGFTPDRQNPLPAYQANIMKILVEGVLGGQVPWTLIMMGGAAAIVVELLGLPALPFAVGMYLPLGLSAPIMVGGSVHWMVHRSRKGSGESDPGVLASSGLVAGMGLMGVTFAGVLALISWLGGSPQWLNPASGETEGVSYTHFMPWIWSKFGAGSMNWGLSRPWWDALPMFPFVGLTAWLWYSARKHPPIVAPSVPAPTPSAPVPTTPEEPGTDEPADEAIKTSGPLDAAASKESAPSDAETPGNAD